MNIKEIEERSGLTRANIRYYEQEGLLAPARRENKYRNYSEEDLETLLRIALLRSLGFSLEEIRRLQSGEADFAAAMRARRAAGEREGPRRRAGRCRAAPVAALLCPRHRPHARGASGLLCAVCAAAPQLHNRFPVGGHRLRSDRLGIAAPP